jgi:hypothetical protein
MDTQGRAPARRCFSVDEFCERNNISRRFFYDEVNRGRLKIKKAGARTLVTVEAENNWIAALPTSSAA